MISGSVLSVEVWSLCIHVYSDLFALSDSVKGVQKTTHVCLLCAFLCMCACVYMCVCVCETMVGREVWAEVIEH